MELSGRERFLILIAFISISLLVGSYLSIDAQLIEDYLSKIPLGISSVIFVILYVVGTFIIWYLKDPLKIVGAIIFGAYLSTFLIYLSEIVNAYIFFNLSKILGRDFVEKKLKGKFKNFYEKVEGLSLGWIFLLRVVPLIPYRVLDMSFGLSKVSFRKYLIAVLVASPFRIFWIQFIFAAVREFSPEKIVIYFMENRLIYLLSMVYCILAFFIAFKMRARFK